jgi:hypothetical protein
LVRISPHHSGCAAPWPGGMPAPILRPEPGRLSAGMLAGDRRPVDAGVLKSRRSARDCLRRVRGSALVAGRGEEIGAALPSSGRGVYKGRKPSIKADEVRRLCKEGLGGTAIARKLGVGRASVYRVLTR